MVQRFTHFLLCIYEILSKSIIMNQCTVPPINILDFWNCLVCALHTRFIRSSNYPIFYYVFTKIRVMGLSSPDHRVFDLPEKTKVFCYKPEDFCIHTEFNQKLLHPIYIALYIHLICILYFRYIYVFYKWKFFSVYEDQRK